MDEDFPITGLEGISDPKARQEMEFLARQQEERRQRLRELQQLQTVLEAEEKKRNEELEYMKRRANMLHFGGSDKDHGIDPKMPGKPPAHIPKPTQHNNNNNNNNSDDIIPGVKRKLPPPELDEAGNEIIPAPPNAPKPAPAFSFSTAQTRGVGEIKLYYHRVIDLFRKAYPYRFLPDLALHVEGTQDYPFRAKIWGSYCYLPPLILATSDQVAKTIFTKQTPKFTESKQRLLDSVDCFYYTPERVQFVLAKSLCQASIGFFSAWDWIKLKFWKTFSTKRFNRALERREMRSDTMAAHLSADIAIGGLEHMAKLNQYYENFQHDMHRDDDATVSDVRFINMLNVIESVHGVSRADAMRIALNNRVTFSGNSRNLVKSAERILDSPALRNYIKKHYPAMTTRELGNNNNNNNDTAI